MAGEWVAISKAVLSPVLRGLPSFVLRWWYPIRKCQDSLIVAIHGVGPHIYVNADRPAAIAGLNWTLINGLPFAVKCEGLHFDTNQDRIVKEAIPGCGIRQVSVSDIYLSDGQAEIVRPHPGECAILQVRGYVQFVMPGGEGKKYFDITTRASIYRG